MELFSRHSCVFSPAAAQFCLLKASIHMDVVI
jgi:hypothetical protein